MTLKEVKKLQPGNKVFWNDPAEGECSKTIKIQHIEVHGDIVEISGADGGFLECYAHELIRLN